MKHWQLYNNTNNVKGKTHIGRLLRFPKEGGYEKRNHFSDDDTIYYDMLCGINGQNYIEDLQTITDVPEDVICFRCLRRYRDIAKYTTLAVQVEHETKKLDTINRSHNPFPILTVHDNTNYES